MLCGLRQVMPGPVRNEAVVFSILSQTILPTTRVGVSRRTEVIRARLAGADVRGNRGTFTGVCIRPFHPWTHLMCP